MYVLGSWAIANMATGAMGWSRNTGSDKYFHQMNFFWNTVNLGIAGFSMYSFSQLNPWMLSNQEIIERHMRIQNLYLINAGLDIAYLGTGFLLRHLSGRNENRADQLMGYGNSVILQGGFLFLFDGVMYAIQKVSLSNYIGNLDFKMLSDGAILSYTYSF